MHNSTSAWQRLLAEMKRRRVFRAMAFYGTGVFALLQLTDLVSPALGLSPSLLRVLMLACLAGFPVAIFAAWTFDLTAYGLQRTHVAASGEIEAILALPGSQRWTAGLLGLLGVVLLALGSWWVLAQELPAAEVAPVAPPFLSVAVLPLHNLGVASDEPFSDGLTEELGLALSRIEGVRVVARTSVYAYKGRSIDARTIGRELGVGTIVEGSVQRSGGSVRISVALSRTADGFRVWTETWERELSAANLFAIQDAIAAEAITALTTGAGPLAPPARVSTVDLKAYDRYLLGQQRWADRNAYALHSAILNYGDAVVPDSAFVSAWVSLSRAWRVLPFYDPRVSGREAIRAGGETPGPGACPHT